jgi:hypothetical protein
LLLLPPDPPVDVQRTLIPSLGGCSLIFKTLWRTDPRIPFHLLTLTGTTQENTHKLVCICPALAEAWLSYMTPTANPNVMPTQHSVACMLGGLLCIAKLNTTVMGYTSPLAIW